MLPVRFVKIIKLLPIEKHLKEMQRHLHLLVYTWLDMNFY